MREHLVKVSILADRCTSMFANADLLQALTTVYRDLHELF